ncbi:MAG: LUD domain-containing protein [Actinomycetota bacterium]|nr:LUD domain-containing protein [Actinomycetota bacterium]
MTALDPGASAREEVLARVRGALAGQPPAAPVPRAYRAAGADVPALDVLVDRLVDRLEDYKATVHPTTVADLPATVADVLAQRSAGRVVVPAGLPGDWTGTWTGGADDREVLVDDGTLTTADLDGVDGVLTACAVAIAETGTIVLDASPDQGRRAITLVPDLHLCVVRTDQVVAGVPEGVARLEPTRPLTFISGPSATSDIELNRVEGVHGPRTLDVLVVDADAG